MQGAEARWLAAAAPPAAAPPPPAAAAASASARHLAPHRRRHQTRPESILAPRTRFRRIRPADRAPFFVARLPVAVARAQEAAALLLRDVRPLLDPRRDEAVPPPRGHRARGQLAARAPVRLRQRVAGRRRGQLLLPWSQRWCAAEQRHAQRPHAERRRGHLRRAGRCAERG